MENKKIETNKTINMRVSLNFYDLIQKLIELEKERGNFSCSQPSATEILYLRIQEKGGLKKD